MSVVQTLPSVRRNDAPADSSPPKPTLPSSSPGTNHLNPTGTSSSRRPSPATTRSMIELDTSVLPTATSAPHGRCANRCSIATARKWLGFMSPPSGVTMPCRSESASLPVATSNGARPSASRSDIRSRRLAMAQGLEQSMRILPSRSSVMNRHVGSTSGLTTVRSRRCVSAIAPQ